MDRRQFINALAAGAAVGTVGLGSVPAWADRPFDPNEKSPAELITPKAQRAIDRGMAFLARRQVKSGNYKGAMGTGGYAAGVATCSLAGLAFMCGGHAPNVGRYGKNVNYCIDYVLSNVRNSGYIALSDNQVHENMYGHGFSMLFLSEVYGMTQKVEVGNKLRKAVELTCKCQNNQGGWRYQPTKSDADLSITVCQIMGLRAARDAGINVPDEVRAKCIEYVRKSQNANGSFRYTQQGGHSTFAMTAAGVTSLYSAGIYDGKEVESALGELLKNKPSGSGGGGHYFYSNYYAVQAMWHAGGRYWNEWYPAIRDQLVDNQGSDGSWPFSEAGPEFGAAMACVILQMPNNYLPVFAA